MVLSREEIARILPEFTDLRRPMFLVMYGAGLRHKECRTLRVKDVCFDEGHIVIRNGKGDKDRITVLPQCCRQQLIEQVERIRRLHKRDLESGFGKVYLPHALERKYPKDQLRGCTSLRCYRLSAVGESFRMPGNQWRRHSRLARIF